MRSRMLCRVLIAASLSVTVNHAVFAAAEEQPEKEEIRLIVRGDDIGSSHAANLACIKAYREGIVRSVEVMVPAPWFNEAVKMLNENPGLDVGVHLTLTSEWEFLKWGPLTQSPSLVDPQGHFFPTTSQRKGFPPNTSFLGANPKTDEVEKELRAQIETAVERIPNVSHLSLHMGTPASTPELRALVDRLAEEYKLPCGAPGSRSARWSAPEFTLEAKEAALLKLLEDLKPGLWVLVEHPGLDCPEMRAIGHLGYRDVAADRDSVTKAFISPKVKEIVEKRGIKLLSYADLYRARTQSSDPK
jgi:predicted glycoside hydrolase/deacetylase ChbG (UPF0249 family)